MTGQKVFKKKQESAEVKCSASEGLSLYAVLRFLFLQKAHEFGAVRLEIESYLRLCRVIDLLQGIRKGSTHSSVLRNAILDHLRGYLNAYSGEKFCQNTTTVRTWEKCTRFTKVSYHAGPTNENTKM